MYDFSIHNDAGRGHHPVAHYLIHIGDLLKLDLDTGQLSSNADEFGGCLAVLAARTQYLDIFFILITS